MADSTDSVLAHPWASVFEVITDVDGFKGYVKTVSQLQELILQYEVCTTTKYAANSALYKNFGETGQRLFLRNK